MDTQSNIHAKIAKIQKELVAPKSQVNAFMKFKYRSCEDILEAVKPLLDGLVLTLSDEVIQLGDRFYIKATAKITDGIVALVTTAMAREEFTKPGLDAAQITGSASSYARKYCLNGLFALSDVADADSHDNSVPKKLVLKASNPPEGGVEIDVDGPRHPILSGYKRMTSKFKGVCKGCQGPIAAGETILYSKENGGRHEGCA